MANSSRINVDINKAPSYRYEETLSRESLMLEELLQTTDVQELFESYYNLINIPIAIIDVKANVLFSSRWQRICTQFHRVHPTTCARCVESDIVLATQLQEGKPYAIYTCKNGLTDSASPIIIEGKHVANVFIGQFLTKEPDEDLFRRQAKEFNFDLVDYMATIREISIIDEKRIPTLLDLLIRTTRVITKLSTDRKNAIENENRHSIILNAIPQSVFWKDRDGKYFGCNMPFAKAAGIATPENIVGKTDFDLPWSGQAEVYRADDSAVISSNEGRLHIIEPLLQADGSRIIIDTSKLPLVDATGVPYGIVGIYEEITERQRIQESLRQSEEKFRLAFMTGLDAFYWATLEDGRIIEVNPVFEDVFGYARDEVIGRTSLELGLYHDLTDHATMISELNEKGFIKDLELKCAKKDGAIITISMSISKVQIDDCWHILGIIRDITQRRQMEDELRRSHDELERRVQERTIELVDAYESLQRTIRKRQETEEQLRQAHKMEAVGTLAGGIAHDFNNILAGMIGFAEMALEDASTDDSRYFLDRVLKGGLRGRELVRQMLTFSRKAEYEVKPLPLIPLIKETMQLLRATIPTTINIELGITAKKDVILANPTGIQQILMNLATNAAHAMQENGGKLSITLSDAYDESSPFVALTVRDTGIGMSPEVSKRIFEPFFTTKEAGKGTGMGLAVVYGVVKSFGGDISVHSTLGRGTAFQILLPRAVADEPPELVSDFTSPMGHEKVLFVDDEETLTDLGKRMLARLGYQITATNSSAEALKIFTEDPLAVDIVITDQTMPELTGLHLAEQLLSIRPDLPIILCTGFSESVDPERVKATGIKEFLMKPLTKPELAAAIRRVLDKKAL